MNETITVKYVPLHYNQENDFRWFLESAVEAYKGSKDDDIAFYQLMEWMRDFAIEQEDSLRNVSERTTNAQ